MVGGGWCHIFRCLCGIYNLDVSAESVVADVVFAKTIASMESATSYMELTVVVVVVAAGSNSLNINNN